MKEFDVVAVNALFDRVITDYHLRDDVDAPCLNPYPSGSLEHLLYRKNWIDTVQWHLEDLIRDPDIDPVEALALKRRIDRSNQERTDMVEYIDSWFLDRYKDVQLRPDVRINTETPAWAVDRLSILALKIYHMRRETERTDVSADHLHRCGEKLSVLLTQRVDLSQAISELLEDIASGTKYLKVYKQMKMYNAADTNPVLYRKK
jgi:hypothetical protein